MENPNKTVINRLDSSDKTFRKELTHLLAFEETQDKSIRETVSHILQDVKARGDEAVVEYTNRFDGMHVSAMSDLKISKEDLKQAFDSLSPKEQHALTVSAERIRIYHQRQLQSSWQYTEADGTMLGQKITPLDRVGLYVPGGKAAYPSSVLMNAIPAKVAGVAELIMVAPTPKGERIPLVLAAAYVSGVDAVYAIGGAQAVAALAFGTKTIMPVDKIVGPGNAYVAEAKRQVFGIVGIDMIAGPSEILIISDGKTSPEWTAMDLFSQAEHDELAQAILLCPDKQFIDRVEAEIKRLCPGMKRKDVIVQSLSNRGALILVKDLAEACEIANFIAPEHLELSVVDPEKWVDHLRHAGAIFMGQYTSESFGDYCAGPNHVLPTSRTARFSSPLGVYDFQKRTSLIQLSKAAIKPLGEIAVTMAMGEGLEAHALSAQYRMDAQ